MDFLESEKIIIYTDGGCHGNPGPGGWGVVIVNAQEEPLLLSGGDACTTNNRMELTAAIKALESVKSNVHLLNKQVCIYSDSQYVKNGITVWIKNWKKNGWKTSAKKAVLNKDLWELLDTLNSSINVTWQWVKGHAGIKYNELCDTLCQQEISKFE